MGKVYDDWHSDGGHADKQQATVDALVAALEGLRGFMPPSGDDLVNAVLNQADAALALARGGK